MHESAPQRIALVTGGAKRVGAAIVRELVESGCEVVFTYNDSVNEADALAASLNGRARAVRCDLAEPDAVDVIVREASFRRLDVLVNNASIYLPDAGLSDRRRNAMHRVNAEVPVALATALAGLLKRSTGCVVNMLDILAEKPMPSYSAYCASKASLWNGTLSLARQLAPQARSVGVAPGVVDWPDAMPQADRDAYLKRVPLGRSGTPLDVARLVRFLALEGPYITGQVIRIDGGRSIA
jgi:pteridine reductase